ncbi:MAG: VOC family protein [Rhodospirillaceae bacterium]|jgi:glyoxylase I family protein|nr:VOC family protein [Rhodospirillaceae bacterium]MBT5190912.1 VOC family protein [Rhodospirillaceae bacterium]MBT5898769.1 VOC family protein [Rhodospirillaceae bacterium]MBT6427676.1 VOC family protein [Rhodospirillaceae bacterium]MBT7759422.1 VOC family protein [Rhodospirillaceae bacterium]
MPVTSTQTRPRRLHHAAWVTRDMEVTRHFYEDIIGVPLTATWAEKAPSTGREYCHTFFEFGDGSALAFFQWADQDENPIELQSPGHVAFECDGETQQGIKQRLEAAGHDIRVTDHGYCVSLYVNDPNNLRLEFTVDHPELERIMAEHQNNPHDDLKRWLSGDHSVNNDIRAH